MTRNTFLSIIFSFAALLINGQDYFGFCKICAYDKKTRVALLDTFTVSFGKGQIYKLNPDPEGCVSIKNIPVGTYEVTLSASNYQFLRFDHITIGQAKTCYLTYQMVPLEKIKTKKKRRRT